MRRHWPLTLALSLVLALALALPSRGDDGLDQLAERLARAPTPAAADTVLDSLAARIGQDGGFSDTAAFATWLGKLPPATAGRVRVRLRRAWAWLAARRPEEARPLLEELVRQGGDERRVALAYLGEAERQGGDLVRAFTLLTAAAAAGYRDRFLVDSVRKTAYQMRVDGSVDKAAGIPGYVTSLESFLLVDDVPLLQGTTARWLLDDYAAYAVPGSERGRAWARAAAPHALSAARTAPGSGADARLLWDAAEALRAEDEATDGRTRRYDLLAWAWRLGNRPDQDTHTLPQAIVALAEAALRDGDFALAERLARQRLSISDSPAARRVLRRVP